MTTTLDLAWRLCAVRFRDEPVTVLARPLTDRAAITDLIDLELACITTAAGWVRPVEVAAVVVTPRAQALAGVHRATRWASYATRVALLHHQDATARVRAEATFYGVWLMATGYRPEVIQPGEVGPCPGSRRGIEHHLLDELVLDHLHTTAPTSHTDGLFTRTYETALTAALNL